MPLYPRFFNTGTDCGSFFAAISLFLVLTFCSTQALGSGDSTEAVTARFFDGNRHHTNNWAILVCSSRFWYNYRHVANVLSMYRSVKRLGIPDSNIIMMLADNIPCNARNPDPGRYFFTEVIQKRQGSSGTIYGNAYRRVNLFPTDVEVDYRGYEVTAENFVRMLTGRVHASTPRTKRLLSNRHSNVLIYLSGHGGDGFLKFQDAEELTNVDLADAIETMHQHERYNEMLVISDTCQSESLYQRIYSPRVLATSSSLVGEDSLSHHVDRSIGVYIIDRYSFYIEQFLEKKVRDLNATATMAEYFAACPKSQCISTVNVRTDLFEKSPQDVRVTDFFGAQHYVKNVVAEKYTQEDLDFILSLQL